MITFIKNAIAMMQLNDGIELFNEVRYVSAIALAGAAEEIFAKISTQESERTGIRLVSAEDIKQFMFESTSELISKKIVTYGLPTVQMFD